MFENGSSHIALIYDSRFNKCFPGSEKIIFYFGVRIPLQRVHACVCAPKDVSNGGGGGDDDDNGCQKVQSKRGAGVSMRAPALMRSAAVACQAHSQQQQQQGSASFRGVRGR